MNFSLRVFQTKYSQGRLEPVSAADASVDLKMRQGEIIRTAIHSGLRAEEGIEFTSKDDFQTVWRNKTGHYHEV